MPDTAVMWFRRDLRVRDLPALAEAARFDRCVPVFVFDERLLTTGRFPSAVRTAFMLGCLGVLDGALRERGGRLVIRHGAAGDRDPEARGGGGRAGRVLHRRLFARGRAVETSV